MKYLWTGSSMWILEQNSAFVTYQICDTWADYFIIQRLSFLICKMKAVIDFWQAIAFYVNKKYIKVPGIGPCMDGVYYTLHVIIILEKTIRFKLRLQFRNEGGDTSKFGIFEKVFFGFHSISPL